MGTSGRRTGHDLPSVRRGSGLTILGLVVGLAACGRTGAGATGPASPTPTGASPSAIDSPSASASPGGWPGQPFAVVLDTSNVKDLNSTYTLTLLGQSGPVLTLQAHDPRAERGPGILNPVSATSTRVYYRDGPTEIHYIDPGTGVQGTAFELPTETASRAVGYSVSPDDSEVAVAVYDYTESASSAPSHTLSWHTHAYVRDMTSGTTKAELVSSDSNFRYPASDLDPGPLGTTTYLAPVGWYGGAVVLSLQAIFGQNGDHGGFSSPDDGYQLINLGTAAVKKVCAGQYIFPPRPFNAFGVECKSPQDNTADASLTTWEGVTTSLVSSSGRHFCQGALSPDGGLLLAKELAGGSQSNCDPAMLVLRLSDGSVTPVHQLESGDNVGFAGWVGSGSVVLERTDPHGPGIVLSEVIDAGSGRSTAISLVGDIMADFPAQP